MIRDLVVTSLVSMVLGSPSPSMDTGPLQDYSTFGVDQMKKNSVKKNSTEMNLHDNVEDDSEADKNGSMVGRVKASPVDFIANVSPQKDGEQREVERLRRSAEEGVKKIDAFVKALRQAAHDSIYINTAANAPAENVKASFYKRREHVVSSINSLQNFRGNEYERLEAELLTAEEEARMLRADQLEVLRQAYRSARNPATQFVRNAQSEVQEEARKVKQRADRIASLCPTKQDDAHKLQDLVEAAIIAAKEQGELLTKRNEDALDRSLSSATDDVWQQDAKLKKSFDDFRLRLDNLKNHKKKDGQASSQNQQNLRASGSGASSRPFLAHKDEENDAAAAVEGKIAVPTQLPTGGSVEGDYEKFIKQYSKYGGGVPSGSGIDYYKGMHLMTTNTSEMNSQSSHVVIHTAQEATNQKQLDDWRNNELKSVLTFVPSAYAQIPSQNIEKMYQQRLHELESSSAADRSGVDSTVKSADEVERLQRFSEECVKKIDALVIALGQAAHDSAFIEKTASEPAGNVEAAFFKRRQHLADTIKSLQILSRDNKSKMRMQAQFLNVEHEAEQLRTDQFEALRQAYRNAGDPAKHFVRTAQNEVEDEARKVKFLADRLTSIFPAKQGLATAFQDRAQAAVHASQEQGELLIRRSDDALNRSLSKAMDDVRQQHVNLEKIFDFRLHLQDKKNSDNEDDKNVTRSIGALEGHRAEIALVGAALLVALLCLKQISNPRNYKSIQLNSVENTFQLNSPKDSEMVLFNRLECDSGGTCHYKD